MYDRALYDVPEGADAREPAREMLASRSLKIVDPMLRFAVVFNLDLFLDDVVESDRIDERDHMEARFTLHFIVGHALEQAQGPSFEVFEALADRSVRRRCPEARDRLHEIVRG
jgi:hypothetical protein